ncbi:PEP-CTERM domain-containing protein [Haloferula helveola]|uniref:PEP-CTERM domain-containing protein n=1 Tax=Haloferula helveola TaxID=490095 RepID=A0ABN6H734_9BACT|nr:PEP-CTERM domain-containing protein [Haloferula helveola]
MFPKIAFLSGVLAALYAPAALGQTFTLDDTAPYDPFSYRILQDYVVKDGLGDPATVNFNNGTGSGPNPYSVNPVSLKRTMVTTGNGTEVPVFDLCTEMFVGPTGTSTYDVSAGFGSLSASQEGDLRILFSNTLADFLITTASDYDDAAVIGAAIQLAAWEIIEDDAFGAGFYSLDDGGIFPGALSVIDYGTGYDGTADAAILLAESYLAEINAGTWSDNGGYNYFYAEAQGGEQDRMWITVGITTIPEPSTALLTLFGLGLVMRRRR